MNAPLIFADKLADILEIIFPLVVFLGAGLMKLYSLMNKQAQKPQPNQPLEPPVPPAQPAPRDALSNEIDEFLRRAAQKKQQRQGGSPRREPVITLKEATERPAEAEVIGTRPVGGGLDKHLQQFTREKKEFEQRAAQLGDEVAQADDKIEAHLKEKFTHRLGTLERRSSETTATLLPAPSGYAESLLPSFPLAAAGFAALLTNTDNLRQAVVLTEILQRPTSRWE
jgi:hypothetical protein